MKNILLEKILAEHPDIEVVSCDILRSRHSHVLEVITPDDTLIFKFPNNDHYNLLKEINVIDSLQGKLSVEIPNIIYRGPKHDFFGYKKIEGRPPSWEEFSSFPDEIKRNIFARAINFLVRLNNTISLGDALKLSVNEDPSKWYIEDIEKNIDILDSDLKKMAQHLISTRPEFTIKQFIFNDLHPNNFIIDDSYNLVGIIDFGFSAVGDIHREFHHIYKICPDMLHELVNTYNIQTGLNISTDKVIWLSRVDLLNYYITLKNCADAKTQEVEYIYQKLLKL